MTNRSNKHRRRLHLIRSETQSSAPAVATESEKQDDINPVDAASAPASQTVANMGKPPRSSAESKVSRPTSSPRFYREWNLMNSLKHLLAFVILVGFGFLYGQHRQAKQNAQDNQNAQTTPFSSWEEIAEAPAFNASDASQTDHTTPEPISLPGQSDSGVPAGLASWLDADQQDASQEKTESFATDTRTSLKNRSNSLWDEPGLDTAKQIQSQVKSDLDSRYNQFSNQLSDAVNTNINNRMETITESVSSQAQEMIPESVRSAIPAASDDPWRQFTLGSGSQTTVCVVDETVSKDALLLSALFAGIRREWTKDASRSREQSLVLLIANKNENKNTSTYSHPSVLPNSQQQKLQLQQRISKLSPTRVIYIKQGNDQRGQLKFSSQEESVAALMSVPGMYRIAAQAMQSGAESETYSNSPKEVHIELPAQSQAQQAANIQLLFTAISGSWGNNEAGSTGLQNQQANRKTKTPFNPFAVLNTQESETNSINKQKNNNGYPNYNSPAAAIKKSLVEILPSPAMYHQQAIAKKPSTRNSFFKLPAPPIRRSR